MLAFFLDFCQTKSVGPLTVNMNRLFPGFVGTGKRANQHVVKVKLDLAKFVPNLKYTP